MNKDMGNLSRPIQDMPDHVRASLEECGLMQAYEARPAFQRNDYLSWIKHAKRQETRDKRLAQMINELQRGDVYMKMVWRPDSRRR